MHMLGDIPSRHMLGDVPAMHMLGDIPVYAGHCSSGSGLGLWQVGVSGLLANNTGTIVGTLPICSSLVHIVDVVLIPAASLDAVPHPKGGPAPAAAPGPAGLVAQGPAEGPLLSPVPRAVPLALPPQSACGQSLLSAADANGLSFLTQVGTPLGGPRACSRVVEDRRACQVGDGESVDGRGGVGERRYVVRAVLPSSCAFRRGTIVCTIVCLQKGERE